VSLRSDIAEVLKAELPAEYHVMAYLKTLDNTSRPVVMIHRSEVTKAPMHHLDHAVTLHVLVPETLGEEAEDAADKALESVLRLVEQMNNLDWTKAERASYENFTGFIVTLTASTRNYLLGE
jgi:alcohol dehydrogenase YqhD (iron-dependent ADH family)